MSRPLVPRARPSLIGLALLLGLAAIVAAALHPAAAHAGGAPPCEPKLTKIGGKRAAVNCGPATVALKLDGHTYHYRHGFCQDSKSAGAELSLDLGTLIPGDKDNGDEPYFSMLIAKGMKDGSVFTAYFGGRELLGDTLITHGGSPMKGTFESDFPGTPFSGSWNCHGVLWHAP